MITGFFVVIGLVFDIAASSTEFNLIDLHMFHVALEVVALIIFLFGVHSLYKAWTKLGL